MHALYQLSHHYSATTFRQGTSHIRSRVDASVGSTHMSQRHLVPLGTLSMLMPFFWWIGMNISTRWCLRRCLKCQARKTSRQPIRWPTLSLPVPNGPGILVRVDYFGPLPLTPRAEVTLTSSFSPTASAAAPTCTL